MSENEPKVQDLLLGGWECLAAACPPWDEPQRAEEPQGPPEKPGDPSGGGAPSSAAPLRGAFPAPPGDGSGGFVDSRPCGPGGARGGGGGSGGARGRGNGGSAALTPSPPGRHGSAAQSVPRNDAAAAGRGRAGPGLSERTGLVPGPFPAVPRRYSLQISAPQPPHKRPRWARQRPVGSQPPPPPLHMPSAGPQNPSKC